MKEGCKCHRVRTANLIGNGLKFFALLVLAITIMSWVLS